jgi:hypothetical protein
MVSMDQIKHMLLTHFRVSGEYDIDPDTGLVHITGSVFLNMPSHITQLPVNFGIVTHSCHWTGHQLKDLTGAPEYVGAWFDTEYTPTMPLLRCLVAQQGVGVNGSHVPPEVYTILNDPKYLGKGKAAAIACAVALTKAGFKANARW